MNCILFDDHFSEQLLPFTYTRPSAKMLVGIWTIEEKWQHYLAAPTSFKPYRTYLEGKYKAQVGAENWYVNGTWLPDEGSVLSVQQLQNGQMLVHEKRVLAARSANQLDSFDIDRLQEQGFVPQQYQSTPVMIRYPEDIFLLNGAELIKDFTRISQGRTSLVADGTNRIIAPENVFIEAGARVSCAIINASAGPVYIGIDAEIMEGAIIKGPFSLGAHSTVKMGAKIYGDTSIGPHCKVGGEITNSVIFGYSNKGHDGFMGNSVIGEWCNWGADTNNSNLKNNYEQVKLWDHTTHRFRSTGLQFAGLMMADHAKCGINTMFNTGTVVGVGANIFGAGFPRNFLPSFCWGGAQGFETFRFSKFIQTASKVMERRGIALDETEAQILEAVYEETAAHRNWEQK